MSEIRAVIFDMDGVLIDARDWHYEALNRALSLWGQEISRQEHLALYDGLPTRRKLELISTERGFPRALHEFVNELKQSYTVEMVHTSCRPIFQHQFALARLSQEGYKLAVASNSIRQTVDLMMARANLAGYLDLSLSSDDVTRAKPDPEIYVTAIERLGLTGGQVVIVEDNDHGMRAAEASGARALRVSDPGEVTYWRIRDFIRQIEGARV